MYKYCFKYINKNCTTVKIYLGITNKFILEERLSRFCIVCTLGALLVKEVSEDPAEKVSLQLQGCLQDLHQAAVVGH